MKVIAQNKKAFFEYTILETLEAGIVLTGDEVKSLRAGHCSLVGTFARVMQGELYIINMGVTPYDHAYQKADEELSRRPRKLLVHKNQLVRLIGDVSKKGITLIPLKIYFNAKNIAKVELGVAKHKKAAGKKQALKERDIKRETAREVKKVYKY
ncbi:MAG: SsrA-binding protein SmpB [Candidatus Babeliales bacterium]